MSDDIMGHDHLDHGRHLPHAARHWEPRARFSRGNRPMHVGLRSVSARSVFTDHAEHEPHVDPHAALHRSTQGTAHHHGHAHGPGCSHHGHQHGHSHQHSHSHGRAFDIRRVSTWLIASAIAIPLIILFARSFPALTAVLVILLLNTIIEYHKYFTTGAPLDLEVLFLGTAYVSALFNGFWGLLLAVVGPLIAAAARGHVCGAAVRKMGALIVTVAAASILAPSRFELVFAILLGVAAHYGIITATGNGNGVSTVLARVTAFGLNAYLALFILPVLGLTA